MKFVQKYFYFVTALLVFIIYLFTLAPSVMQIDSGELAAVQATLGIAHPTGYPLYTMLGYLFSLIPLPFTKIFQLNILAAIYCATAAGVFTFTIKYCLDNPTAFKERSTSKESKKKEKKKDKAHIHKTEEPIEIPENIKFIAAIFGGLTFAFSRTFWFQSTSVEVYSLHLLLISLILLFLLKAYIKSFENDKLANWLWFAFFLALGFTNHLTTILILPGTAYLYFIRYGFNSASIKKLSLMILLFIVVLAAVYSYLPIRASQNPILNWGNPVDWERIYRHVTGKQYQVWLFSSFDAAGKQFNHFWSILPAEFYVSLLFALVGLFVSLSRSKKLFAFCLITFLSTVAYSINYDIHDIDSYFLLAFGMISFFASFGALKALEMKNTQKNSALIGLSIVVLIQLFFNYQDVDQSGVYTYEDYTKAVLNTVPKNSIVFSYQWDYFISASYYYQFIENERRDVTIIDKELLRRSWYYKQLDNYDPKVLNGVRNEVEQFLIALKPFERSEKYDSNRLETLFRSIMTNLIKTNVKERDYFIAPEVVEQELRRGEFNLPDGYNLIPYLFFYKVVEGDEYLPAPEPDFLLRLPSKRNAYLDNIEGLIGRTLSNRAYYEVKFGRTDRAKIYLKKILKDLPGFRLPQSLQDILKH